MLRPLFLLFAMLLTLPAHAVTLGSLLDGPPPQERVYKTIGDSALKLFYLSPTTNSKTPRPAVIWIHGGAWVAGDAAPFLPHARYFAARGAVGISLEYRLSKNGGPGVAECLSDCKSALRYIRAHAKELNIDPQRIAVAGDSAGGHLAAALGTLNGFDDAGDKTISAVPNAMILCNPIVDMTEGDWAYFAALGYGPKAPKPAITPEMLERARALSPLFAVAKNQPPTLLLHGLNDKVVSPEQSRKFAAAMQTAGNRCDLVLLGNARHAFVVPRYTAPESLVVDALRRADEFLASLGYLSGEPTLTVSQPAAWTPK